MARNRSRRAIIAAVVSILWLAYMAVGLAAINAALPTVGGEGPEGTAAFIGLVWGFFAIGTIMWAASD
jgi:hypothetical protein